MPKKPIDIFDRDINPSQIFAIEPYKPPFDPACAPLRSELFQIVSERWEHSTGLVAE